jgi:GNAT superfamily N-acetyltransferase
LTTPAPSLREANENDVLALTALINGANGPAESFLYDGPRITAAEIREKLDHGRFLLDVDSVGNFRGCVYVAITGEAGYFGLLAVSPASQKQGRGRSLVGAAESFCRAKSCRVMTIDVVDQRHELFPFYSRLGYEVVGERPFDDARLKRPAHFVVMRKALDNPR